MWVQSRGKSPEGTEKKREGLRDKSAVMNAPLGLVAVISRMAPPKSLGAGGVQAGGSFEGVAEFSA